MSFLVYKSNHPVASWLILALARLSTVLQKKAKLPANFSTGRSSIWAVCSEVSRVSFAANIL